MSRKISNFETDYENMELDDLILLYVQNKSEYESYKEIYEKENSTIKSAMKKQGLVDYSAHGHNIKYVVQQREIWDELKLLQVAKNNNLISVIKTKEYVDIDELEKLLYNMDKISENLISEIDSCRTIKEIVSLRLKEDKNNG